MTLIEIFDRDHMDNLAACLYLKPEKAIFLGDGKHMEAPLARIGHLLGTQTRVMPYHVDLGDTGDIQRVLKYILRTREEFVIDITGGSEQVILAVGMVLGSLEPDRRKSVQVQKFDPATGAVLDADGDGKVIVGEPVALTVEQLVALYGGVIFPDSRQPGLHYRPEDVEPLWNAMCAHRKDWNKAVMALNEFESRCDSDIHICLDLFQAAQRINRFDEKEARLRWLLDQLSRCAVIDDRSTAEMLCYVYLDPMLQSCARKAGNLLEIKALLEARAVQSEGKPYFHDCVMGVNIDWDGVVHDTAKRVPETRNEIDLILMRGMVPLFVSCKNGEIGEEELYKLNTVARQFGGTHARKMLIATELDRGKPAANQAFLQRARDMGIYVVADAAALSQRGWHRAFREAMEE